MPFQNYFKDFKKTLSIDVLKKIYQTIMNKEDLKAIGCTPIEELITEDFGEIGTPSRNEFELSCDAFILGERLKEERIKAGMTQAELAEKIGTKKSFISRVENGHVDIQLSTLFRIFNGLGRRVSLSIL